MTLDLFILGTGGMMPLPHRHLVSALIRREGDLFLFDCGEATQIALRKQELSWKKLHTIFISHTHADHITGLPGLLMLSSQADRTEPLHLIGPPRLRQYVESALDVLEMHINYPLVVTQIEEPHLPQIVAEGNDWFVRSFPLKHSRVCVGYSFEEKPRPGIFHPENCQALEIPRGPLWGQLQQGNPIKLGSGKIIQPQDVMGPSRQGRKFCFVTDTLYDKKIAEEIHGADIALLEGMFLEDKKDDAQRKKHMTACQAASLALQGRVKKMGLIHYSPRYIKADLKKLLEEAKLVFPQSFLSFDGQHINIPYPDEEEI